ncbi:hypothetical protein RJ641_031586 [Dillenia turbinata]|uniref:Uncharacterized protein n=1 Tax=Dillenia turbinata TaxID=194707 RepID=A0AAN8VN26_9MAGN
MDIATKGSHRLKYPSSLRPRKFVQPIYNVIGDKSRKQVQEPLSSLGAFDTICINATTEDIALVVTLHLKGLDLKLPVENIIRRSSGSVACLAMAAALSNLNLMLNYLLDFPEDGLGGSRRTSSRSFSAAFFASGTNPSSFLFVSELETE